VDEAAVRNTKNVELLPRRVDLAEATEALSCAGFVHRHLRGVDVFLDGPGGKSRDAIHLVFAGEKVHPDYVMVAPDISESEATPTFRLISLKALVRMKLTSFRDRDRTHLRDLIEVGLVDNTWYQLLPEPLATRLQNLISLPED
jgi:hypothetical protein